ncbi:MAG: prepilin-type N-terminal cleavage/methylation domain-containing protein [Candidatus Azotimanducaceae bacterium]|jgi:prepilin-type N-terminal cleavage/methylation domain-containing protein
MPRNHKSGFTLVEIMIVVVIIGLLAAIAIPAFRRVRIRSQNARLASDLRTYGGMVETYLLINGDYPEASAPGIIPAGFDAYIKIGSWNQGPSIGGVWDMEKDSDGILSAIGVHQFTVPNEQLVEFDKDYDDGNVDTGKYRKLADDRYYYVVAE